MPVKLTELGKKVGLSPKELRAKIEALGFTVKPRAREIGDDIASLVEGELKKSKGASEEKPSEEATGEESGMKVYEEFIEQQLEKEIIKTQRKKTAGGRITPKAKREEGVKIAIAEHPFPPAPGTAVEIPELITVKEFSEKTGIPPVKVIGQLMKNGILANINQEIDFETASVVAIDFGVPLKRKRAKALLADVLSGNLEALLKEEDTTELLSRPPIVTVMGHVDHGKTSLLDAIRETNVAAKEVGGITQRIGAYQVEKNGRKITFIDTPGHEAFTAMRARGAKVTDIAILVVAGDEGVKPQTIEALDHAKEAEVPIIVAINKIDKDGVNPDRVKAELSELGLQPEEWGGKTIMVPVSAHTHQGIPMLLEMILLVSELENVKANPSRPGIATVLEAHLDRSLGPIASVIINTGTLHIGDAFVCGEVFGRIKLLKDHDGKSLKLAPPSTPVLIAGLSMTPQVGDILQVISSEKDAREKAGMITQMRKKEFARPSTTIQDIISKIKAGKLKIVKAVLKADTKGSLEAIEHALMQLKSEEVSLKVIHAGIGGITETDVDMAEASEGIVIGFNVEADVATRKLAEDAHTQIFTYQIIYELLDDIKKILAGMLEPEMVSVTLGRAEVRKVFLKQKNEMIVGCKVLSGRLERAAKLRVFRGDQQVGEGSLGSLRRVDETVQEVKEGFECGVRYLGETLLKEGDILEAWKEQASESPALARHSSLATG